MKNIILRWKAVRSGYSVLKKNPQQRNTTIFYFLMFSLIQGKKDSTLV